MNILFRLHVHGRQIRCRHVGSLMEKLGHKVLTPYNAFEADAESAPKGSQVYRRDMAWIEQCELFIDEDFRIFVRDRIQTGYLLGATDKTITLLYRRALEVKYHC